MELGVPWGPGTNSPADTKERLCICSLILDVNVAEALGTWPGYAYHACWPREPAL